MKTLTITTGSAADANFLAAFLKTVKIVKTVVINEKTDLSIISEPEEEYNWINPSRPATDEEFEQMISECEAEYEAGLGIPSKLARKQSLDELKKWKKEKL